MAAALWGVAGFVLAAAGTRAALAYARHRSLLDLPDARRNHAVPTPRGGGIGIAAALLVVYAAAAWIGSWSALQAAACSLGLILVAGAGWVDDHRPVSPWGRLATHAAAGLLLAIVPASGGDWWAAACAVLLVPALVNIWNFMDGINGIATIKTVVCLLLLCLLLPGEGAWPVWAMLGACLGFLPFNFPKARIFLGDVGSGTLGFALAAAVILNVGYTGDLAWLMLMPAAPFLVDAGFTLLKRMIRRERWWLPHSQHLYQRLVRGGRSHTHVALGYAAFSMLAVILALFIAELNLERTLLFGVIAGWFLFVSAVWFSIKDGTDAEENSGLE